MKKIFLTLFFLLLASNNLYALSPEIRFDMLKARLTSELKIDNREAILTTLGEMKELGVPLPKSFAYFEGKALFESGKQAQAYEKLEGYVTANGKNGKYYSKAIAYLVKAEPYLIKETRVENEDGSYVISKLDSFNSGLKVEYHPSGKVKMSLPFVNGKFEGEVISYYENGQVQLVEEYSNGVENGITVMNYKNGDIAILNTYKNGKKHGKCFQQYNNGTIASSGTYKNGKKHGLFFEQYENNKLQSSGTYENGKLIGELTSYPQNSPN